MSEENKYTFENEEYRRTYWHTCSHVLAQAVKRLHPEVKLAIGPSIENGFYYDLDAPFAFTQDDLAEIEGEMRKICKEKLKLERFELPREEALKYMEEREEPYKVELINDLPADAHISFYKQGEFVDLCAGPHVDSTGRIKGNGIKLTACNAAYWRGDSNRQTLQRIYGVAFPSKDELDAYLKGKNRLCDYLVSTTKTEGRRCSNELAWSRVIWDITTVAWLLDERFMEDYLMPSPIPEYDGHYSVDPKRHLMRYVYHVNRDKVFSDLFTKLANFG